MAARVPLSCSGLRYSLLHYFSLQEQRRSRNIVEYYSSFCKLMQVQIPRMKTRAIGQRSRPPLTQLDVDIEGGTHNLNTWTERAKKAKENKLQYGIYCRSIGMNSNETTTSPILLLASVPFHSNAPSLQFNIE